MKLLTVLQRESPLTLARETLWRARRRWRQVRLVGRLQSPQCPVRYQPLGYYQIDLERVDERSRRAILGVANLICEGRFPFFAYPTPRLGFPPRWDFDFVSGISWPATSGGKVQFARHDGSDVKVPWDLSRLQFLSVLGKAWRLSGEERYRNAARELLSDWIAKNPVGTGVNWTIAMEAALRATSICLFLDLVSSQAEVPEDAWQRQVNTSLWQHLLFIEAHNEFSHFVRGNHYLSNLLGLFTLAAFLRGTEADRRRVAYRRLLEQEIFVQVYPDGGSYEASTGYHLLNLQMFTTAFILMRRIRMEASPEYAKRLQDMYRFLAVLASRRGRVPHLGDCDDGRVELLVDDMEQMLISDPNERYTLTISGALGIGEALFRDSYGGNHADAAWYGSVPVAEEDSRDSFADHNPTVFPDSGLAVGRKGPWEIVFSAMPNGIKGKGTHTHNDKLGVVVRIHGEDLFSDAGTGCYTRDIRVRNRFRSTSAHNTVQIDGQEQNRIPPARNSAFVIGDEAHVTAIRSSETAGSIIVSASHNGYKRLGVLHTRRLELSSAARLTLEDSFTGSGHHSFEMRFHLSRQWRVKVHQERGREVHCLIESTHWAIDFACRAPVDLRCSCSPAKISPAYGLTVDASTIAICGSFEATATLVSSISQRS